ncbi:MAG TPA: hypothetical protein VGN20_26105 [Mucilaginibacter sp.]|jgi:hypothetical protein
MEIPDDNVKELQQTSEVVEKLAADPAAFKKAYAAYKANDPVEFEAALTKVGIAERCHVVCVFFCRKHCVGICGKFCPKPANVEVNAEEMLAYARAVGPLFRDEAIVRRFLDIMKAEDVKAWAEIIKEYKLEPYCHQLCSLLFSWRCRKSCHELCPAKPLITNVGNIPVTQIDALGYGNGPDVLHLYVPAPDPANGVGDHPFGANIAIKGIFNMATATEYLVEISSTGAGGTYNPLIVGPQNGYDTVPPQLPDPPPAILATEPASPPAPPPILFIRSRTQSTGLDPGWFKIDEITDSDGGRATTGEKLLLTWPSSPPDGVYYLRLRVRDALLNTRVSSPQVVRIDNTGPFPLPRPIITLQLKKPDGTLVALKCGKVRKGDGLILITIQAFDPNMSTVSVTARGNSGLSVPVIDTSLTPLSITYNGILANEGYVAPTQFLWDPWSDPNIVPCCYLIYVDINDRTILNGVWYGGHSNEGWEAIEIGL